VVGPVHKENKGHVTQWPCHYIKKYPKEKEEIIKTQIIHHAKIQSSQNPLKEIKILQDIITL
jgi:hypothetical protein